MITATIHHPAPGETKSFTVFGKPLGQMQFYSAETGDFGGTIIVNREEALAMSEAFAELAKDIEGAEKITALGKGEAA